MGGELWGEGLAGRPRLLCLRDHTSEVVEVCMGTKEQSWSGDLQRTSVLCRRGESRQMAARGPQPQPSWCLKAPSALQSLVQLGGGVCCPAAPPAPSFCLGTHLVHQGPLVELQELSLNA